MGKRYILSPVKSFIFFEPVCLLRQSLILLNKVISNLSIIIPKTKNSAFQQSLILFKREFYILFTTLIPRRESPFLIVFPANSEI